MTIVPTSSLECGVSQAAPAGACVNAPLLSEAERHAWCGWAVFGVFFHPSMDTWGVGTSQLLWLVLLEHEDARL